MEKIELEVFFWAHLILREIAFGKAVIWLDAYSAVFKFGGLLRLLNINLIKQDKPIS